MTEEPSSSFISNSKDFHEEISLKTCVSKRISEGATGYAAVDVQLKEFNEYLMSMKGNN